MDVDVDVEGSNAGDGVRDGSKGVGPLVHTLSITTHSKILFIVLVQWKGRARRGQNSIGHTDDELGPWLCVG
jgi:hypothetical protein